MHTDMADKAAKMDLTALAKAVNDEFGMEKVKAFDDQTEGIKNLLTTRGDEYIPSLYDKGIRGVWVSPIIQSGWRYQGPAF